MKKPITGSFNEVTNAFAGIVARNPALAAKQGWPTSRAAQESWIDSREAHRMLAHGWVEFVQLEGEEVAPPPGVKKNQWRSVVGASKRVASGAALLTDWLGSGKVPVVSEVAERRALVCSTCPKNGKGDWTAYFTVPAADQIRTLLSIKYDLDLSTSVDNQLGVCEACSCPLKLKSWCPLDVILQRTDKDVYGRLDPRCWILEERSRAEP